MASEPAGFVVSVVAASGDWDALIGEPAEPFVLRVLETAAAAEQARGAVDVLLAGDPDLQALNAQWRGKDAPTNVLSFPAPATAMGHLGDLALSADTISREAENQAKTPDAHFAHLLVHGLLHLLGYDHQTDPEAKVMEAREVALLALLGYDDPYSADA